MTGSEGKSREGARRIGAVERALLVLDALGDAGGEIGTNELARRTGINASSVSRLLATLVDAGYAEPTPSGRYRLGVRLLQLGSRALDGLDLRALARPALEALAAETGETATLSVSGGRDAVTLDFAHSPQAVQSVAQLGRPSVAHATATGKVLLAFGGVARPAGRLTRYTDLTITDPDALARDVARCRELGWAAAVGEREPDLAALAAPVFGSRGELVAILGVQGPAGRFDAAARKAGRHRADPCGRRPLRAARLVARRVSRGSRPHEARRPLACRPQRLLVLTPSHPIGICPENDQSGRLLADQLDERLDRSRREDADALSSNAERGGELRRSAERRLDVLPDDRLGERHPGHRVVAPADDVGDDEGLAVLDSGVHGDLCCLLEERDVERDEQDGPGSRPWRPEGGERAVRTGARAHPASRPVSDRPSLGLELPAGADLGHATAGAFPDLREHEEPVGHHGDEQQEGVPHVADDRRRHEDRRQEERGADREPLVAADAGEQRAVLVGRDLRGVIGLPARGACPALAGRRSRSASRSRT